MIAVLAQKAKELKQARGKYMDWVGRMLSREAGTNRRQSGVRAGNGVAAELAKRARAPKRPGAR